MTDFSYRLVVLTHGDAPHLDSVIEAFAANVTPLPTDRVCVIDGPGRMPMIDPLGPWRFLTWPGQRGFCAATEKAWHEASADGPDYVFWMENDFVIDRPVPLYDLADVLDANRNVAQMALMRDAVNGAEKAAGGLFESRPGQYEPRWWTPTPGNEWAPAWHEHRAYFTTNPSLMRREFMVDHPWPDYTDQCEGRFGLDLVRDGWRFGVWGDGSVWCRHVGVRAGRGY